MSLNHSSEHDSVHPRSHRTNSNGGHMNHSSAQQSMNARRRNENNPKGEINLNENNGIQDTVLDILENKDTRGEENLSNDYVPNGRILANDDKGRIYIRRLSLRPKHK